MADIYLKKQDLELGLLFDIVVENNDITIDNTYITGSILSIFTDGSKPQIGTQIDGETLGNENYNISNLSNDNIKNYIEGLNNALQWLIDDGIVETITIATQKQGNALGVTINFKTDKDNEDNLIFSLDQNLEILN